MKSNRNLIRLSDINISFNDVFSKLIKLDTRKAIGYDGVHPYVLKSGAEGFATPLALIFQKSLAEGEIPSVWKRANVTALFKKGNKGEASNYRPVSLTSIACKIMERIVSEEITKHFTKNDLFTKEQHGFIKGKNCTTNLLETLDEITFELSQGNSIDVLYTDMAKAFDTVSHTKLLVKTQAYGIGYLIINWLSSFLTGRTQRVVMGESASVWLEIKRGVPQGSVLGPLLFLIYINDLPEVVDNSTKLYADDNKNFQIVNTISDSVRMQNNINELCKWSNDWQIDFNISKCKVMHFGKNNNKFEYIMCTNEEEKTLMKTKLERDVGVYISDELNWDYQIQEVTSKANKKLGWLSRAFTYKDIHIMKILYCTFVRPLLEFAVPVWSPNFEKQVDILERVQRRATKLIPSIRHFSYDDRLKAIGIMSLRKRRLRGDLIQQYKIFHKIDMVKWYNEPHFAPSLLCSGPASNIRGHKARMEVEDIVHFEKRRNFFTNRICEHWNKLPHSTVFAKSVNSFKARLDDYLENLDV